jgi:F-box/leucine-rich repeat protein 2/20
MLILFAGLKSISKCSKLSSLKIGICLNISDKGLSHIGMKCSKLADLDLYRYLVAILEFFPSFSFSQADQPMFCYYFPGSSQWNASN